MAEIHHEEFPPIALRRSLLSRVGSYMAIHPEESVKRICNVNFPFYKETSQKFLKARTNALIFNKKFETVFSYRVHLTERNKKGYEPK